MEVLLFVGFCLSLVSGAWSCDNPQPLDLGYYAGSLPGVGQAGAHPGLAVVYPDCDGQGGAGEFSAGGARILWVRAHPS